MGTSVVESTIKVKFLKKEIFLLSRSKYVINWGYSGEVKF